MAFLFSILILDFRRIVASRSASILAAAMRPDQKDHFLPILASFFRTVEVDKCKFHTTPCSLLFMNLQQILKCSFHRPREICQLSSIPPLSAFCLLCSFLSACCLFQNAVLILFPVQFMKMTASDSFPQSDSVSVLHKKMMAAELLRFRGTDVPPSNSHASFLIF